MTYYIAELSRVVVNTSRGLKMAFCSDDFLVIFQDNNVLGFIFNPTLLMLLPTQWNHFQQFCVKNVILNFYVTNCEVVEDPADQNVAWGFKWHKK